MDCSLTAKIVTMADNLCNIAKTTGRLISVNATNEKRLLIELPDLECDTTVSCGNTTTTLFDLIKRMDSEDDLNVLITGLGGCGKSFSLLSVATKILQPYMNACKNNFLLENEVGVIPVYVPLNSFLSDASNIENYIIKKLAQFQMSTYETAESQFLKWKTSLADKENSQYILLMLDGWNEIVSQEKQLKTLADIQQLQHDRAYRMIITSRYNLSKTFSIGTITTKFVSFKMNDLEDKVIIDYVKKIFIQNGKNENELSIINGLKEQNGKIKDIYRKPMGLVMFCAVHSRKLDDTEDFFSQINTLGELLHAFMFCIKNAYNSDDIRIYEKFLCYFGYRMNIDGVFTVTEADFEKYCTDFINEYHYNNQVTTDNIKNNRLVNDVTKCQDISVSQISFNHQNYRDYFAALFLKKIIKSGNIEEINEKTGIDKKIPREVLTILSELIGEYKYVDVPGNTNNKGIQGVLNLIGSKLQASAVALLIKVAVIGRNFDLSHFLFQSLDLTLTNLNNVVLFRKEENEEEDNTICAEFNECTVSQSTFAPTGHAGAPQAILYLENRYILTFAKNGICCLDLKTGFSNMVADYDSDAILSAVHIPDSNRIVTGDVKGNLFLWEYIVNNKNNDFQILKNKSYSINEDKNLKRETAVHDIVILDNKIIFSLKNGGIFSADYSLEEISIIINLHEYKDSSCKYCRLEVIDNELYIAYERKIFKQNVGCCSPIHNIEHSDGYIYDISRVKNNRCSAILINYRNKKINNSDSSVVYMLDTISNNSSKLVQIEHTITSQGFKGWNKFSEPFNHDSTVYLTANINDAPEEAGLYLFSFKAVRNKDCKSLKCVRNAEECFGNSHIMSVERALFFKYNKREYIATTSIDRCVEILDVSGTEANLIYHIEGHTNGIPCMDIINENTIYTSHYSGEVCRWIKTNNTWKCKTIVKVHSNEWVWVIKHAKQADIDYMIAGSYDHNISITNAVLGKSVIMYGCKGRIKSLDLLNENSVITAYDYKMNNKNKFAVHIFKNIDFTTGIAENIVIYDSPAYIQCMCTDKDNLYLVVNQDSKSNVYCINKDTLINDDGTMNIFSDIYYEIGKSYISRNNSKMRSIDVMQTDNGMKFFACGGEMDTLYGEVWIENGKKAIINGRPTSITEITEKYDSEDGISSIKFAKYKGIIYLIFGSYDFHLYTYKISIDSGEIFLEYLSAVNNNEKVLNVQYIENTGLVYVSLLSGHVITYHIDSLIANSTIIPEVLFQASTGMHIVNVDLTECIKTDITDDFKKIINYYGEI